MANAVGTKMPRGDKTVIMNYHFKLPNEVTEQWAIVDALNDMSRNIEYLQHKLTLAHRIKQGMMQQLLTGKIRLAEESWHE